MEGEETFDSSLLGQAEEVVEERVADDDVIMIKGTKTTSAVGTILLSYSSQILGPFLCDFSVHGTVQFKIITFQFISGFIGPEGRK